ncbi:gamma-butyrobetaine dioxygenase-like, partial [Paramuricea clavata]
SIFEIRAFSEHSTHEIGYSDSNLPMHSDFSFNQAVPAVAMFHCIEQTEGEGGANLWVDAFHAANLLYEEDPELFQILVNTPVIFRNVTKTQVGHMYNESRHSLIR